MGEQYEHLKEAGKNTRFSKTNRPKNPGRKPSYLKKYIKESNVGVEDIRKMLSYVITARNMDLLKRLVEEDKTPAALRIMASAIIKDVKRGKIDTLQWMIEYAYGKAKQDIDMTNKIVDVADLPPEERDAIVEEILQRYKIVEDFDRNEQNNNG
jgi:predicted hydrocarbon binding protein